MWTLIIITIAFSGALSGASSSTAYLDFADQSKCEAAAIAIVEMLAQSCRRRSACRHAR
jgi:hypothetical protein